MLAATLATGGVASHLSAAALWNLEPFTAPPLTVTVAANHRCRRQRGLDIHRSTQWSQRDEVRRHGIPTTGVERTLLDCAAVHSVSAPVLERLAESAIRQSLTSWDTLADHCRENAGCGRPGSTAFGSLLDDRFRSVVPLSDFSHRVANLLMADGLPQPVLEYRIAGRDGQFIMQADLAWPDRKKAWELDGLQWHFGRPHVERDRRKRNQARADGWRIQEILWSMYANERPQLISLARRFLLDA